MTPAIRVAAAALVVRGFADISGGGGLLVLAGAGLVLFTALLIEDIEGGGR